MKLLPHPPLVQEITAALVAVPFTPFVIITGKDEKGYRVPTRHHAHVTPAGDVFVWTGQGDAETVRIAAVGVTDLAPLTLVA